MKKLTFPIRVISRAEMVELLIAYEVVFGTDSFRNDPFFRHLKYKTVSELDDVAHNVAFEIVWRRAKKRPSETGNRVRHAQDETHLWALLRDLYGDEPAIRTAVRCSWPAPAELAVLDDPWMIPE